MAKELRVYGTTGNRAKPLAHNKYNHQSREIVAVTTYTAAFRCFLASGLNLSMKEMRTYGGWTGNEESVRQAMSKPGTVFFQHIDAHRGSEWTEATRE